MKNLEFNKIAAALLLGGVIAMTSGTIAKVFYGSEGGHGHEHTEKRGFTIEVVDDAQAAGAGTPAAEADVGTLLAKADAAAGAAVAKKCMACHSFEKGGANKVGPNLWGFLDKKKAHIADFQYSDAMKASEGTWTVEAFWEFINNPKDYIKGTKMAFAGIKNPEERANLIAYLNTMADSPAKLPAPKAAAAPVAEPKAEPAAAATPATTEVKK